MRVTGVLTRCVRQHGTTGGWRWTGRRNRAHRGAAGGGSRHQGDGGLGRRHHPAASLRGGAVAGSSPSPASSSVRPWQAQATRHPETRTVTVTSIVTSLVPVPTTTRRPTTTEPVTTTTRRPRPATTTRGPRPTATEPPEENCDPSYPDFCIPHHHQISTAMTSTGATSQSCRPTRTGSMAIAMGWAVRAARRLLAADADSAVCP